MSQIIVGHEVRYVRSCPGCGEWFYPDRPDQKACSDTCRKRVNKGKRPQKRPPDSQAVLRLRPFNASDIHNRRVVVVELTEELVKKLPERGHWSLDVIVVKVDAPEVRTRRDGPLQWQLRVDGKWVDYPDPDWTKVRMEHLQVRAKPEGPEQPEIVINYQIKRGEKWVDIPNPPDWEKCKEVIRMKDDEESKK